MPSQEETDELELEHAVGEDLTHPLGVETVDVAPADTTGTN
jgi:hypothetical protein